MPVTAETKFGGYAETIIKNPADYNALEIHGVSETFDGEGGESWEVADENPEFFSVYAHLVVGGIEPIGDFRTVVDAEAYTKEIGDKHGWEWTNYAGGR